MTPFTPPKLSHLLKTMKTAQEYYEENFRMTTVDTREEDFITLIKSVQQDAIGSSRIAFELLRQVHEQLECVVRNTTVTSHRRDGSVIISSDLRYKIRDVVCPEPTVPCKLCGSPVGLHNETRVCSDCELRMHQEAQVP